MLILRGQGIWTKAVLGAALVCLPLPSLAQQQQTASAQEISAEQQLEDLFQQLKRSPENLDLNFKYANLAAKLGKYDESISAFERMLIMKPDLPRVKLDMALVYMKMGQYGESFKLFDEVLASNPPEAVKSNIERMKKVARRGMRRHNLSGTVTVGYNSDTNVNASPTSGAVEIFGIEVPIDDTSARQTDDSRFGVISLNHRFKMRAQQKHTWNTQATVYKGMQSSEKSLDVTSYSASTGPVFDIPAIKGQLGVVLGYDDVNLAQSDYLRQTSGQIYTEHLIHPRAKLRFALKHENRRFRNTPTTTTYELRNGDAKQQDISLKIALSEKDLLGISATFRQEDALVDYYRNRSKALRFNYTRALRDDIFMVFTAGLKNTHYKGVDVLVNPNVVRHDLERSYSVGLGKKLGEKWTAAASYSYREVDSNLQNYEYENERISTSLTRSF